MYKLLGTLISQWPTCIIQLYTYSKPHTVYEFWNTPIFFFSYFMQTMLFTRIFDVIIPFARKQVFKNMSSSLGCLSISSWVFAGDWNLQTFWKLSFWKFLTYKKEKRIFTSFVNYKLMVYFVSPAPPPCCNRLFWSKSQISYPLIHQYHHMSHVHIPLLNSQIIFRFDLCESGSIYSHTAFGW